MASVVLACTMAAAPAASQTTYHVYFLGGQSNMDGYGHVRDLPVELQGEVEGALILHGNPAPDDSSIGGQGVWRPLRPGHGAGFTSEGESNMYAERFGLELTFATRLRAIDPESNIAIIKYSRGGSSLDADAAGYSDPWHYDSSGFLDLGRRFADALVGIRER